MRRLSNGPNDQTQILNVICLRSLVNEDFACSDTINFASLDFYYYCFESFLHLLDDDGDMNEWERVAGTALRCSHQHSCVWKPIAPFSEAEPRCSPSDRWNSIQLRFRFFFRSNQNMPSRIEPRGTIRFEHLAMKFVLNRNWRKNAF